MTFQQACEAVCAPGTMFELGEAEIRGIPTTVFTSAPPNIRALFALAAAHGDAEFVIYEDERITMSQLLTQAAQIGHALVNEFGVCKGDRVAIAMRNFPEWLSSFAAIVQIGAVAVPLNAWWKTDEMVYALNDSGATVVFVDDDRLRRLNEAPDGAIDVRSILVRGDASTPAAHATRLEDILVDGATLPDVEIDPDDNMSILYTSGTTGFPKGATSTHRSVLSALLSFAARAQVGALTDPPPAPEECSSEEGTAEDPACFILCVPLFHVTGLVPVMLGSFLSGAKSVIMHKWEANRALELIERERVTNFVGVPTMSWDLLEAETFEARDTSTLRSVGGGGAPMPAETRATHRRQFCPRPTWSWLWHDRDQRLWPPERGRCVRPEPNVDRPLYPGHADSDHRPRRQCTPNRRDRRDLVRRPDADQGVLEQARGDRRNNR